MRWTQLILMMIALLPGCKNSATTGEERADEHDVEYLQGVWVADSYEYKEKPVGDAVLKRTRIIFEGDTLELIEAAEVGELVTFSLDESTEPKQINLRIAKGPDSGRISMGIYRLNGDFLRICWAAPGQPRPTAFTTLNGMGVACLSLHRLGETD
jgi:uncharacterized protein (TIGR03067 family)